MALDFGLIKYKPEIISDIPREYENATLVTASNTASNSQNTVYTVGAGKKLMLMSLVMESRNSNNIGTGSILPMTASIKAQYQGM